MSTGDHTVHDKKGDTVAINKIDQKTVDHIDKHHYELPPTAGLVRIFGKVINGGGGIHPLPVSGPYGPIRLTLSTTIDGEQYIFHTDLINKNHDGSLSFSVLAGQDKIYRCNHEDEHHHEHHGDAHHDDHHESIGCVHVDWSLPRNLNSQPQDRIYFELDHEGSLIPIGNASPIGTVSGEKVFIDITQEMIINQEILNDEDGEELYLEEDYRSRTNITKISFKGHILKADNSGLPINPGSTLLIHNVNKNLIKICRPSNRGCYETTFTTTDFHPNVQSVASIGDEIRYVLFEDVFPHLAEILQGQDEAVVDPLSYPGSGDTIVTGTNIINGSNDGFVGYLEGEPGARPAVLLPADNAYVPPVPDGLWTVIGTITLNDIDCYSGHGIKVANFRANFVASALSKTITVISKPIDIELQADCDNPTDDGRHMPIRALPYIDLTLPKNKKIGIPFEFKMYICNNAHDENPYWEEIPHDRLPNLNISGRILFPGSTNPLRLHVFKNRTRRDARKSWAIALKIEMTRNDATGSYILHAWGVRWWNLRSPYVHDNHVHNHHSSGHQICDNHEHHEN